jgi:hypothetical protein
MMGRISTSGLDDYPPVGSVLAVSVLGYSGTSTTAVDRDL